MRVRLTILAALFALAVPARAQQVVNDSGDELTEAIKYATKGKWAEALPLLDRYLADYERRTGDVPGIRLCANDESEARRYVAFAHIDPSKDIIGVGTEPCVALYFKGKALFQTGKVVDAVPWLEKAVAMSPMDTFYLNDLAYAYLEAGAAQKAYDTHVIALRVAELETAPDMLRVTRCMAWRGMARAKMSQGRFDEAMALVRKCLEVSPGDKNANALLKEIERHQNKPRTQP